MLIRVREVSLVSRELKREALGCQIMPVSDFGRAVDCL